MIRINPFRSSFMLPVFLIFLATVMPVNPAAAQELTLDNAREISMAGDFRAARLIFSRLLEIDPDNVDYLINNAYNDSWAGDHLNAETGFRKALSLEPANHQALIGAGYNQAWAKNYAEAREYFNKIKTLGPETEEMQKGLAYTYLWEGQYKIAILYFKRLVNEHPDNPEYHLALGQSYEKQNQNNKARKEFIRTIELDAVHEAAAIMLKQLDYKASFAEIDLWGGVNVFDTLTKVGLRHAQLGIQLGKRARGFVKYDNSFSLENKNYAVLQKSVPSFSIGILAGWNKHLTTYFENGMRFFKDDGNAYFFSGEQVVFLNSRLQVKAGGLYSAFDDNTSEWMAFTGFSFPLGKHLSIEPIYFHTRPRYAGSGHENRFLAKAQYKSAEGYELTIGAMMGKAGIVPENFDRRVYSGFIYGVLPFSRQVWGLVSINREWGVFDDFTSINAGIKVRIDR